MDESTFAKHNLRYGYNGNLKTIRETEFTRLQGTTYLDHAGTTMYSEKQLQSAMQDLMTNTYGNPHSQSSCSLKTTERIEQVRDQILQFFNTTSKYYHVIFTSGCTDGLKKVAEWFPWAPFSNFVYSEESHNSVVGMREYALKRGARFHTIQNSMLAGSTGVDQSALSAFLNKIQSSDTPSDHNHKCHHNHHNHNQHNHNSNHDDNHDSNHNNHDNNHNNHDSNHNTQSTIINGDDDVKRNLFAFPGQCNFSGTKYSLQEITTHIKTNHPHWRVLVDGASLVGTAPVDLSDNQIDFLTFSFHKMVGYPTGLGALVVRCDAALDLLNSKTYFGGGTVEVSLPQERFHVLRPPPLGLEDGTISFLAIISVSYGLSCLSQLGMSSISSHVGTLTKYLVQKLRSYLHPNGSPVVIVYGHNEIEDIETNYEKRYGGIVSFNLLQPDGSYIPYTEVDKLASLYNIQLRTGCFCNPGACHGSLGISSADARANYGSGHVCWDDRALLNGRPTGAIRVSLGYMSSFGDALKFLEFIEENYVFISPPEPTFHATAPKSSIKVKNLVVYPIKSCAGFEVQEWEVDESGLKFDREWALVDSKGVYVNQKKAAKLCLVQPSIDLKNGLLHLEASNLPTLSLPLHEYPQKLAIQSFNESDDNGLNFNEELLLRICGDNCAGYAYSQKVTKWFADATGIPNLTLVRKNPAKERISRLAATQKPEEGWGATKANLRFANESPFLLISAVSVKDLVSRIPGNLSYICESSFRPNIVLSGGLVPYEEDEWKHIHIGRYQFASLGGCNRCKMITIDQLSGTEGSEPLRTLAHYRRSTTGRILFGIHLALDDQNFHNSSGSGSGGIESTCVLRVGDTVDVKK